MAQKITAIDGRKVMSCREAAELLGLTMGRVRQMARAGTLWAGQVTDRVVVLDAAEVKALAKRRQLARDAGMVPGAKPGGFKPV